MKLVKLPFLPEFEAAMLSGRKTMTTRIERQNIEAGDRFKAFGRWFTIVAVIPTILGAVANNEYEAEGFDSTDAFWDVWERLHPKRRHPGQDTWTFEFRLEEAPS